MLLDKEQVWYVVSAASEQSNRAQGLDEPL